MNDEAHEFLSALFGRKPERAAIQIWLRGVKPVTWHIDTVAGAATRAVVDTSVDVYVGCGLSPQGQPRPTRTRTKAAEVVGIPGVWADIDVDGGPEDKHGVAPTREAALELASSLLEPTLIVNSGYGIQAWWLFDDGPWMFENRGQQEQAARLVAGFQGALRAAARRAGWGLDATQDLARVMRIPGTQNHKGAAPVPVELLDIDSSGVLYVPEQLEEFGQGVTGAPTLLELRGDVNITITDGASPHVVVTELLTTEPDFNSVWRMRSGAMGNKRKSWSRSEFEMSICNWLVRAGLTDQEIADTLTYWWASNDGPEKARPDRIALTIAKVRSTVDTETRKEERITAGERAIAGLEGVEEGVEPPNEAKVLALFNQLIGGPALARLRQHSRDPEFARFSFELETGREISIGRFEKLMDEREFRKLYATATGHLPPSVGVKKWEAAVGSLLKIAVIEEDEHASAQAITRSWLGDYYQSSGSTDKDGACAMGAPFSTDGKLFVSTQHMLRWVRRSAGERIDSPDLQHRLRMVGFERRTVNYKVSETRRSSRSYFVAWADEALSESAAV